jgi:hypothetical protein
MVKMAFSVSQSQCEKLNSPLNDLNNPVLVVSHRSSNVEVRKGLIGLLFK